MQDLYAVEVNDPAGFPQDLSEADKAALLPIQPISLQPLLSRERLLESALLLSIVHFLREEKHKAECVEFAMGVRLMQRVCQGKPVCCFLSPLVTIFVNGVIVKQKVIPRNR